MIMAIHVSVRSGVGHRRLLGLDHGEEGMLNVKGPLYKVVG